MIIQKKLLKAKKQGLVKPSEQNRQSSEQAENKPHRGRPKGKKVKGINNNQESMLGNLLDEYIEGNFYLETMKRFHPKNSNWPRL